MFSKMKQINRKPGQDYTLSKDYTEKGLEQYLTDKNYTIIRTNKCNSNGMISKYLVCKVNNCANYENGNACFKITSKSNEDKFSFYISPNHTNETNRSELISIDSSTPSTSACLNVNQSEDSSQRMIEFVKSSNGSDTYMLTGIYYSIQKNEDSRYIYGCEDGKLIVQRRSNPNSYRK